MVQSDVFNIHLRYNPDPFPYVLVAKFPYNLLPKVQPFPYVFALPFFHSPFVVGTYLPIYSHSSLWYHHVSIFSSTTMRGEVIMLRTAVFVHIKNHKSVPNDICDKRRVYFFTKYYRCYHEFEIFMM